MGVRITVAREPIRGIGVACVRHRCRPPVGLLRSEEGYAREGTLGDVRSGVCRICGSVTRSVLVTDGEQRPSLAIVRSLGRAGYRVVVASSGRRGIAGASRCCKSEVITRDPLCDPVGFVSDVVQALRRWQIDVLLPVTDAALLALLPQRERYQATCVPFPALETYKAVCDKVQLLDAAAELGIAIPNQIVLESPGDLEGREAQNLEYPVVVKPGRSVIGNHTRRLKVGVSYAGDRESLRLQLRTLPEPAYPVAVQERIIGPGKGVFLLRWERETVASFSHVRIREKPPAGGISVYCESVPVDPDLLAISESLLERFDWQGVAMIEYKVDCKTLKPYLMEVNGRFWGSLQLAIDAGVDFPALLVACALGKTPEPTESYRTGVRSRWWWGDVDHLLVRVRRSGNELALPPNAPSRLKAIQEFLKPWRRGDRSQVFRLRDPLPFVRETVSWFKRQ